MPPDWGVHGAAVLPEAALDNRLIGAVEAVILKLLRQRLMGKVVLCHDQKAGGILVNPVDNAGAQLAVDAGEPVAAVEHEGVYQRIVPVSGGRMDDDALGLVEYQHVRVLPNHVQRQIAGLDLDLAHFGQLDRVDGPGYSLVLLAQGLAVLRHRPGLQQLLRRRAGHILKRLGQKHVQTQAGRFGFQNHRIHLPKNRFRGSRQSGMRIRES